MTELEQLLIQAGHRRAPHGKNWICVHCPPDHAPALGIFKGKDGGEMYHCHRCHTTGNVITLKKELGLFEKLPRPTHDEALERHCRILLHREAERIIKDEQMKLTLRHCHLVQQLDGLNRIGLYQCHTDGAPDEAILLQAHQFETERETIEAELNLLLNSKPEDWYHIAEEDLLYLSKPKT